jgi:rhodanese-related sulfurtransferase
MEYTGDDCLSPGLCINFVCDVPASASCERDGAEGRRISIWGTPIMASLEIDVRKAHDCLKSSCNTLLVCAYEGDEEFHKHDLEGAISLNEFRSRLPSIPKTQSTIFYCACPYDEAALGQAKKYRQEGFVNAQALKGGDKAWRDAGFPVAAMV